MLKKSFALFLSLFLFTSCGTATESTSPKETDVTVSSDGETVYEDIKVMDLVIPKSNKTKLDSWNTNNVSFYVGHKYKIYINYFEEVLDLHYSATETLQMKAVDTYDLYYTKIDSLKDFDDESYNNAIVDLIDCTDSCFSIYKVSYNEKDFYYGFGEYNGYCYIAELNKYSDWNDPFETDSVSAEELEKIVNSFADVLESAKPL